MSDASILEKVYQVIRERIDHPPAKSYVVSLVNGGADRIGAKIREEAAELAEAGQEADQAHLVHEAADLLFHALVLLAFRNSEPAAVFRELERRFGTSGITEKESRAAKDDHAQR